MRTLPAELEERPCVVAEARRDPAMLEALMDALTSFTMVDRAHPRIIPTEQLPEEERRWHSDAALVLVLDGWVRRYDDTELVSGTLGRVRLAAEFFVKAWSLRDARQAAEAEALRAAQGAKFGAQRVIRTRRPGSLACYVRRTAGRARGPMCVIGMHRRNATVFRDEAEARAFAEGVLQPLAGQVPGFYSDESWCDFFELAPADEVPGAWSM